MKYGPALLGPLLVTVQPLTERWKSSATPRHTRAEAGSPLLVAMSAAAIRPAISAAIVDGEKPPCSSQRSEPKLGPWLMARSEEHTSELQSRPHLVCRLLLEKKKQACQVVWMEEIQKKSVLNR